MDVVTTPRRLYFQTNSHPPLHEIDRKLDVFKSSLDTEAKGKYFCTAGN